MHFFNADFIRAHFSQFQSLCFTKSSCKTLQNLPNIIYSKFQRSFFHFVEKATRLGFWICIQIKYGKIWTISLDLFVEHKLWNWEEWATKKKPKYQFGLNYTIKCESSLQHGWTYNILELIPWRRIWHVLGHFLYYFFMLLFFPNSPFASYNIIQWAKTRKKV